MTNTAGLNSFNAVDLLEPISDLTFRTRIAADRIGVVFNITTIVVVQEGGSGAKEGTATGAPSAPAAGTAKTTISHLTAGMTVVAPSVDVALLVAVDEAACAAGAPVLGRHTMSGRRRGRRVRAPGRWRRVSGRRRAA